MKLFIVGASGRTGLSLTQQALAAGHEVTAFGRHAPEAAVGLRFILGDPQHLGDLSASVPGHDAVISCLGQRTPRDAGLLTGAAAATVTAIQTSGVRRYIVVSQGLLFPTINPVVILLRQLLSRHVSDSRAMERIVRDSTSDWTIVRPPRLTNGAGSQGFRIAPEAQPSGSWSLAYADLGACLLSLAEKQSHIRETVGVGSYL
jgi:putative NADH-flavin reductase